MKRTALKAMALATAAALTLTPAVYAGTDPAVVAAGAAQATLTEGFPASMQTAVNEGKIREPRWHRQVEYFAKNAPGRLKEYWAYSPSMDRQVPLLVIQGGDLNKPRPTLYMLNGGDGGEGLANWIAQTDIVDFYKNKDVNVVVPMQGAFSYYTDWESDAPSLGGKQMWETFLTKELPGPLEEAIGGNGLRGISGMSMSATSSLLLAEHNPGFYDAVGSFSGCASTSSTLWGLLSAFMTLLRGEASAAQAWGPLFSDTRNNADALVNTEGLRGSKIYVSNGSGFPGSGDMLSSETVDYNIASFLARVIDGAIIEGVTNACTHDLKAKLDSEDIPATFNFRQNGTHTWTYWEKDLRDSWPVFAEAFGLEVKDGDLDPPKPDKHDDGESFRYGLKKVLLSDGGSAGSSSGSSALDALGLDKYLGEAIDSSTEGSSPGSLSSESSDMGSSESAEMSSDS